MAAVPLSPATFRLMQAIILLTSIAQSFLGFAVEALMAHLVPPDDQGRASGWFQAGNLGGNGIGGGLGLWLLTKLPAGWEAGLILAVLVLGCAALAGAAAGRGGGTARRLPGRGDRQNLERDLAGAERARRRALRGALLRSGRHGHRQQVLAQSEVAAHWGAGSNEVALVQGFLGGIVSMFGCLAGGYACIRLGGRTGYVVFGGLMAAVAAVMACLPATPLIYLAGNLAYAFTTGLCYAAFSAFVFHAIGAGVAATKYNGYASLSNIPIGYMGLLLAAVETWLGPRGMLCADAAFGIAGILVIAVVARLWPARPAGAPVPA